MRSRRLYHVVAVAENDVIGKDNKLPWHYPADLAYFKKLTLGSTVIMGRKTFESIGRPLPGRTNLVLSRSKVIEDEGIQSFVSINDALKCAKTEKAFIIGGAQLYAETLAQVDGIYLTRIHKSFEGDAYYRSEALSAFRLKTKSILAENPLIEALYYEKAPL